MAADRVDGVDKAQRPAEGAEADPEPREAVAPEPTHAAPDAHAESAGAEADAPKSGRGVGRVTKIVFGLSVALFIWYVLADRFTPYTDQARVDAFIVPIVPWVSGYVTSVEVQLHDIVEADDVIVQIDRRPYELALQQAQAELAVATQNVGAGSASVEANAARLGVSLATLDRAQRNFDRVQAIQERNPGALSLADRDQAETSLASAQERVASAEADLEASKRQLGPAGGDNPNIQAAIAAVGKAQLDLEFATVRAPTRGAIENTRLDIGYFASAGQAIGTFISMTDSWIQADLRENNLAHIEVGDPVDLVLDVAPGRVFKGTVRTVGFGVSEGFSSGTGDLETVSETSGWLRDPQRFPVIISFADREGAEYRRAGGQANLIVYTGRRPILNAIGKLRIRLVSWLSFVR
jgi:multidrug resistance efflux pump